jgi:hypothetical protein
MLFFNIPSKIFRHIFMSYEAKFIFSYKDVTVIKLFIKLFDFDF